MGIPTVSPAGKSTKVNVPGYETEVPFEKVETVKGNIEYPSQKVQPYSIDAATGIKTGNVIHDLSYLQQVKQDLHRNYLKYDEGALKTGKSPTVDLFINDLKKDIDSVIEGFVPGYRELNTKYADAATAMDELPTLSQLMKGGADVNSPSVTYQLDRFNQALSGVDGRFAQQLFNDLKLVGKEYSDIAAANPQSLGIQGKSQFGINMSNALGLRSQSGKLPRNAETIKQYANVVLNAAARSNPELVNGLMQGIANSDIPALNLVGSLMAPQFNDILEPPLISSKGALNSWFGGVIHNPQEKNIYRKDVMDSDMTNAEKTQRIKAVNKDGTAIPLK
jgi:hypothetical protein